MRLARLPQILGWRFVAAPLAVWLALACAGTAGLVLAERSSHTSLVQRFDLRVGLVADFVTSYVTDLIDRERVQAAAFLTERKVPEREFSRAVNSFGYPAAVLLDARGRVLHLTPPDSALIGKDLTDRYPHLRTAVREGRPAVSPVVPSAARGVPVVAFAVPFDTPYGRRVFSGAVAIADGPLAAYLTTAVPLPEVKLHLIDAVGAIVAANHTEVRRVTTLAEHEPVLAAARGAGRSRFRQGGQWWRQLSRTIPGTPWQLSAAVPEGVLYAPATNGQVAGRAALVTASLVGLLVVALTARGRRDQRELQASEQRFRMVFDNSRIGMFLTDPAGNFVRVNRALCNMLGRSESELLGHSFTQFTHPDDLEECLAYADACLTGRADSFLVDKRYLHTDGHVIETTVTATLLRDQHGQPQYFATQIIDITERRTMERARERDEAALAEHAERLQRANGQMADFIAMLTHDVRQPLATIVSGGEMLLEEWCDIPDETKHYYLRRMTTAGHRAEQLVSEILTLAQLDDGALTARPARVDVAHAVREAVNAQGCDPLNPIRVTAGDQVSAFADPVHLQLVLGNLLGNATKYGAPPVEVTVTDDPAWVRVEVSDHGEGVPEEFVPTMFERFTRADSGVATTKPGTGLGLYLVRQLAEASGATVAYRSNQPHGATFVLALPRTPFGRGLSAGTAVEPGVIPVGAN
ncbi:PAS domain S-box protein [Actinoplanes oblitus]|uniref:Sensor-like histidine kinase SenX3 n=1 Tax=Actinoplanes oblitus TaxID=3040509 RepID=A0ABY8W5L3_9ACTN|nr:PAS domain S-box protein [Actinoplanes oblitus]WIM92978.1 PAS domain S-box protein [Actinoplanes oblitus]